MLSPLLKDYRANVNVDKAKYLENVLVRLEKDFGYLKNPSQLPRAYEKALVEIKRRKKFRKTLDEDFKKIKDLIVSEKANRDSFMNEFGKFLPSEFVP